MESIKLIDTTLRDGTASLWAMNMRTGHMLSVLAAIDRAGFDQIDFFAPGSRLKKFVRHLGEDPWHWLRMGADIATDTPLRWLGGIPTARGWGPSPAVATLLIEKAVSLGIRHTRILDPWNDYERLGADKDRLDGVGMTSVLDIVYSVSPDRTDAYWIECARKAAALDPFRVCLKDVGGLLTPDRVRDLVPKLMHAADGVDWEFHGHCNNGLGPLNALEAAKAGVRYIHTAIPPLANGYSLPSVYNVAENLRLRGFEVDIDLDVLRPVSEYLNDVAKAQGFPRGVPAEYEESIYGHQIPGGMISNLEYQLSQVSMEDRLDEVIEETAKVRAEFGYPIMVTPLSQIVGSQAAVNVIVGERYKQVTDESIHYSWGRNGDEAVERMNSGIRALILDRPRARELECVEPPNPTIEELRKKYGSEITDEELILLATVGDDALDVIADRPVPEPIDPGRSVLRDLLSGLLAQDDYERISIEKGDLRVTVGR